MRRYLAILTAAALLLVLFAPTRQQASATFPIFTPALQEMLYIPGVAVDVIEAQQAAATNEQVVFGAIDRVRVQGGQLTREELFAIYAYTGVPEAWREELAAISWCESRWSPYAVGDGGASLGLNQLNKGWFPRFAGPGADPYNPITNVWVAVQLREVLGRWGGGGGWTCAGMVGIH